MALRSIRLPDHLAREIDDLAAARRVPRSRLVREAIERYCAAARSGRAADRVTLLRQLVNYPGSGKGDLGERSEHYLRELFRGRRRRHPR
jgi:hypothetical protein